jgi:uncharacterized protein (TIGR03790 family)
MSRLHRCGLVSLALSFLVATQIRAEVTPDQVLIVVNDSSRISVAIGRYYAEVRSIPHTFHLLDGTKSVETVPREVYNTQIRDPLVEYFTVTRPDLRDHIRFIVLTKGVPLRIENTDGGRLNPTEACVDSELTQLFSGKVPDNGQKGSVPNPFYDTYRLPEVFQPTRASYLVFRLDGYQTDIDPQTGVPYDILRLINDAQNPADHGRVVFDCAMGSGFGNDEMLEANRLLRMMGIPTLVDRTSFFQKNLTDILAYWSWGSHEPINPGPPYYGDVPLGSGDKYPGTFLPGAITGNWVSTDGRTFDVERVYGQSLIADLIDLGVTGATGHVYEPFLNKVVQPQILFPRYFQGLQLGTAFYQSMSALSWQNVTVCDPLQVSKVTGKLTPEVTTIEPARARALRQIRGWSFTGEHLTGPDDMTVRVGSDLADTLAVSNRQSMTCRSPILLPGFHDVTVTTFMGSAVLPRGLTVFPAIELQGALDLGSVVDLDLHGKTGEWFTLLVGFGLAPQETEWGILYLDLSLGIQTLLSGVFTGDLQSVTATVPQDSNLQGMTFYLQALSGPDQDRMRFSNLVSATVGS